MIGRLLNKASTSTLSSNSQQQGLSSNQNATSINPTVSNFDSYEDAYMRTILYGSDEKLKSFNFNNEFFKILVTQEGTFGSKQVLFDSSCTSNPFTSMDSKNLYRQHNVDDINEYMFGSGIPTIENHCSTKLHVLHHLNVNTSQSAVLITRIFLLSGEMVNQHNAVISNTSPRDNMNSNWIPEPTLPVNENIQGSTTRFAIGLIIPIDDLRDVSEILGQNWEEISFFLLELQRTIEKKLLSSLLNSTNKTKSANPSSSPTMSSSTGSCDTLELSSSPYYSEKRIMFPVQFLQTDHDLSISQSKKLVKLINALANTPRLMNGLTMTSKSFAKTWLLEVLNWLEYKDGKAPGSSQQNHIAHNSNHTSSAMNTKQYTFLSSLLALIIPKRQLLSQKPINYSSVDKALKKSGEKKIMRIVIMTANPIVTKKLVFIINGLIPNSEIEIKYESQSPIGDHSMAFESGAESVIKGTTNTGRIDIKNTANSSKAIPIRPETSSPESTRSFTSSTTSIKGWEIPKASTTSVSMKSSTNGPIATGINVIQPQSSSISNSSSVAYLSSSFSSLNSSNLSLSKLGSSFLDKWKSSMVSANTEQNQHSNIKPRSSVNSLRASPAHETDEYPWYSQAPTTPVSNKFAPISRTNSMFDLNNNSSIPQARYFTPKLPHIKRTRTSLISTGKEREKSSKQVIKDKIVSILECTPKFTVDGEYLDVDALCFGDLKEEEEEEADTLINVDKSGSDSTNDVDVLSFLEESAKRLTKPIPLLLNTGFLDEFRPEFTIQSCPVSQNLESQVINAMKNDLKFYKYNCGFEYVSTETIFISLRAREIKHIELSTMDSNQGQAVNSLPHYKSSGFGHGSSPTTTFDTYANQTNNNSGVDYKTTIKKIFSPSKNSGDKECIGKIEFILNEVSDLFATLKKGSDEIDEITFQNNMDALIHSLVDHN